MKKSIVIFLLICIFLSLAYFFNANSSSHLFESTGDTRKDLKNMVTFINSQIGKNEASLYDLKDYLRIKDNFNYSSCKPKLVNYKQWAGSTDGLDALYISTFGGHINSVVFVTNGDVSIETIKTIIENHLDKSLQIYVSVEYLNPNTKSVHASFHITNERGLISSEYNCSSKWHRF